MEQAETFLTDLTSLGPQSLSDLVERFKNASLPVKIVFSLLAIFGLTSCRGWLKHITVRLAWAGKRRAARKRRERALQALQDALPTDQEAREKNKAITELPIEELGRQLQEGQLKPPEVLTAYQQQALASHLETNCLVGPIAEAREWAESVQSQDNRGLLYGLPIALKDDHGLQGYDSVIGCSKFIDNPEKEDSVIVQVLKKQGAIPFVRTNVPQTMISSETSNPVYGTTTNVYDHSRSAGGSSGGTAALVASGGAILGTGSDIGGSIRCPAAFNGVCGFKPTGGRLSSKGMKLPLEGSVNLVPASYGPLSRDVAGCVLFMKAMCSGYMSLLDPTVPPVPFSNEALEDKRPLRIGYFLDNGILPAVPACQRAVMVAAEALQKAGHQVSPVSLPDCDGLRSYISHCAFGDQGTDVLNTLRYDAIDMKAIRFLFVGLITPIWLKKLLSVIISPVSKKMSRTVRNTCGFSTVTEWWKISKEFSTDCDQFYRYWKREKLDAIICPSLATHTIELGNPGVLADASSYNMIFNTSNCPAGVVPVTKVTKEDEKKAADEYPSTTRIHRIIKENAMQNAAGLPVAVQCATLPWQDELCLRVMKEIEHNVQMQ